jgi:hypothetical protein
MSLYLVFGPFRAPTRCRTRRPHPKPSGSRDVQKLADQMWSSEDPLEVAKRAFESVLEATGMPPRPSNVIPFRR